MENLPWIVECMTLGQGVSWLADSALLEGIEETMLLVFGLLCGMDKYDNGMQRSGSSDLNGSITPLPL